LAPGDRGVVQPPAAAVQGYPRRVRGGPLRRGPWQGAGPGGAGPHRAGHEVRGRRRNDTPVSMTNLRADEDEKSVFAPKSHYCDPRAVR